MKVNWGVRFRNRTWLSLFISAILAIVYVVLEIFDIFPRITEGMFLRIVEAILMILSLVGVIVDPTTAGLNDSNRAHGYYEPWDDNCESTEDGGNG